MVIIIKYLFIKKCSKYKEFSTPRNRLPVTKPFGILGHQWSLFDLFNFFLLDRL